MYLCQPEVCGCIAVVLDAYVRCACAYPRNVADGDETMVLVARKILRWQARHHATNASVDDLIFEINEIIDHVLITHGVDNTSTAPSSGLTGYSLAKSLVRQFALPHRDVYLCPAGCMPDTHAQNAGDGRKVCHLCDTCFLDGTNSPIYVLRYVRKCSIRAQR